MSDTNKHKIKNTKVENGSLISGDKAILSVGDYFINNLNKFQLYKCICIDLHFVTFEKIKGFANNEIGKYQEFQTAHFIDDELNLVKCEN